MFRFEKYRGLVAAPFTPMDASGKVDVSVIPEYYRFLEKNGITGAFVNGSTGEGPSLTQKEKQANARAWVKCLKEGGRIRVINLAGGTSCEETIENALFSMEEGLSAIAVVAPYYFKPADTGLLAEFVARIGESVPEMPVYFYHIPALTGVYFPMSEFLAKISKILPNFAGIKYTYEDFMDFQRCLAFEGGKYDMLWGRDECLLPALSVGCSGAVGSTYNYAAPLYNEIMTSFKNGDLEKARELQLLSIAIVGILGRYGNMGAGKAFMKYVGFDLGKFRLPVRNVSDGMFSAFEADVKKLGIDHLFSHR